MFEPYDKENASIEDNAAWTLCQIIDDNAPMGWTRYRFAATCIAKNKELMDCLKILSEEDAPAFDRNEFLGIFANRLQALQQELPSEFSKTVDSHFWDLLRED